MTTYTDSAGRPQEAIGIFDAANTAAGVNIVFVPTLDTSAYAAGDVAWDFALIDNVLTAAGRMSLLQSITAADQADVGPSLTLLFAKASAALGTFNAAPTISDTDSFKIMAPPLQIAATDWIDLGGSRVAGKSNIGSILTATSGVGIYCAGLFTAGGTAGTFAANSLQFTLGILQG